MLLRIVCHSAGQVHKKHIVANFWCITCPQVLGVHLLKWHKPAGPKWLLVLVWCWNILILVRNPFEFVPIVKYDFPGSWILSYSSIVDGLTISSTYLFWNLCYIKSIRCCVHKGHSIQDSVFAYHISNCEWFIMAMHKVSHGVMVTSLGGSLPYFFLFSLNLWWLAAIVLCILSLPGWHK